MSAHGGAENGVQSRPRAVVWSLRAETASAAHLPLLESLNKQGAEPVVVQSDLWAMAHACLLGKGTLLVLCEPAKLSGPAQVVLALRKYSPGVVVYAFVPGSTQLLRPVNDQDLVDWGAPGKPAAEQTRLAPPRASGSGKPFLRLTDEGEPRPIGPSLPITEHVASVTIADVLSAEELAMLLGRNGSKGSDGIGGGNAKGDQR